MSQGSYVTAAAATAGVLAGAYCAYHLYNENKKPKLPTTWQMVGTLKEINLYPIKSCGPINKNTAECTFLGLKDGWLRDRSLMVVDDKSNFITARAFPELLLVQPIVRNSILTLKCHDMEILNVNLAEVIALQTPKEATVWGVKVPVYDCGSEASKWFSSLLGKSSCSYSLVLYASQQSRALRTTTNKKYKFTTNDTGAFPDEVPFNIINQASVDDLNSRLNGVKVTHKNFRGNFLISGAQEYDEDNWKFVKIGENIFEIIKPCTRCIMTTIDPETGVRDPKAEPLETLKSYRQILDPEERRTCGNSPRMGLQMALRSGNGGHVTINDIIYVA